MKRMLLIAILASSFTFISYGQTTIGHVGANGTIDNGSTPVIACSEQTFVITSYTASSGYQICSVIWQWQFANSPTYGVILQGDAAFTINVSSNMSVSAIITFGTAGAGGCANTYTSTSNSLGITVIPQTLSFSSSNALSSCGLTQNYSINPISCVASYTYGIGQNPPGVYFTGTSNSQTLTTTATTVGVTLPAGSGQFVLMATPNYVDGTTGTTVSAPYSFGIPGLTISVNKIVGITAFISTQNYAGYNYTWTVNGGIPNGGSTGSSCEDELICGKANPVKVTATNNCGTTSASGSAFVACGGGGPLKVGITPNPTHGTSKITLETDDALTTQSQELKIRAIRIVDLSGRILRKFEFGSGVTEAAINTGGLQPNIYILHIFDGTKWTHKEIIVK